MRIDTVCWTQATTGSNYVVYERLKESSLLRPLWRSEHDVGFGARLAAGEQTPRGLLLALPRTSRDRRMTPRRKRKREREREASCRLSRSRERERETREKRERKK